MVVGFLFDITGNYDIPFAVCGSIQTVGGVCALCAYMVKHYRREARQVSQ